MRTTHRPTWVVALAAVVALSLTSAACGTRRTHDELLASAQVENGAAAGTTNVTASGAGRGPVGAGGSNAPADPVDGASDVAGATPTPGQVAEGAQGDAPAGPDAAPAEQQPAPEAAACTGDEPPLVIGSVGQMTGAVGNGVIDEVRATQAWVAAINERGGVNCHRITYLVVDDGGDPARHQSLVRQMVERDGVVAILTPTAALTGRASVAYLTEQRIPVIGGVAGPWAYESPVYFPHTAGGPDGVPAVESVQFRAIAEYATARGQRDLGVITCQESTDCASINENAERHAGNAGLNLVYNGRASALQPDYTSVCQAAQRAGATILYPVIGPAGVTRLGESCARVNYHPLYIVPQVTATPAMASDPNLVPLGVIMPVLPWMISDNAAIAEFQETLAQYAPSVAPGPASIIGWVGAKLFEEATRNLPEPTSEAILEGMWSIRENDLGGLTVPLTFDRDQTRGAHPCWWLAEGNDGQYTSPNGGRRNCA